MPFTLVLIAADIHTSRAFEDLVDPPIKVDQGYASKSARWQLGSGAVYRAAGRGHGPWIASSDAISATIRPRAPDAGSRTSSPDAKDRYGE
jgi:hypothetical protein